MESQGRQWSAGARSAEGERKDVHDRVANWLFAGAGLMLAVSAIAVVASLFMLPVPFHSCLKVLASVGMELPEAARTCVRIG